MLFPCTLLVACACLFQAPPSPRAPAAPDRLPQTLTAGIERIVIDGKFDDWTPIAPTLIDPADAPNSFVDFGEVRVSHDDRFVHLLIDFCRTVNAQGLDGTAMILLDVDGDPRTGTVEHNLPGVDLIVDLTPPPPPPQGSAPATAGKPGMGMAIRSTTFAPNPSDPAAKALIPYDIDLAFAPTHAGRRMEFRLLRGVELPQTPVLFGGDHFTGKLVFVDLNGAVADETEAFSHALGGRAKPQAAAAAQEVDPLARGTNVALRVLTWNAERGALFTRPEAFVRTLAAIQPDLILLQELTDKNSAAQLRDFLQKALPSAGAGADWNVAFGEGGGDLRCAVATRWNLQPTDSLKLIAFPDQPDRFVRAVGAAVQHNGRTVLATSIHLKCCGRADGPEDQQRKREIHAIHAAIRAALRGGAVDAVLIAGDFNLVGTRDPLELMAGGLDLDRSNLTIVDAYQPDQLTNATWADPKQPFAPGRLDYMLFADSRLELVRSFVYDSRDLAPRWLQAHGVQAEDSATASDHMPVVADFAWITTAHP